MSDDSSRESDSRINTWLLLFVSVGIILRLLRYFLDMPVWGDEAALAINILNHGYSALRRPLDYLQVAPIGFLWSERAMYGHFGMSEWSMRFLPMLAGIGSLVLFAWWARLMATPLAAAIAVGILAVGNYSVRYAVEMKPYGYDLLAAILLLLPATLFLLRRQNRWLLCLLVVTPIALILSYPAVFVAGGVGLALMLNVRTMSKLQIALCAFLGLEMIGAFWLLVWGVGQAQYHYTQTGMAADWQNAFPPANPLRFIWWFILIHTGNMFEYPFGGANGASAGSFLVFLFGLAVWLPKRRRELVCLILAPFALNFVAAVLHRYPYGGSARVAQALAPAIILMIGVGAAGLIDRFIGEPRQRLLARRSVFAGLLIFGAAVGADMALHPYKSRDDAQARSVIRNLFRRAGPSDIIAVLMPRAQVHVTLQWYLREHDQRITWDAAVNRSWQNFSGPIWVLNLKPSPGIQKRLEGKLHRPATFVERYVATHDLQTIPLRYWELFGFAAKSAG
ncbi:MAG TPA: hypothetical protein VHX86_14455 [Tepidisphaeraceae bacterium]|jgi:hypothetical protein|nr:hypothetical protein [Tepidisphaeraceae bacterium]